MQNKYSYHLVIQQYYAASYGWEDCSEYETDSRYYPSKETYKLYKHDIAGYRLLGYPTRTIRRRELIGGIKS